MLLLLQHRFTHWQFIYIQKPLLIYRNIILRIFAIVIVNWFLVNVNNSGLIYDVNLVLKLSLLFMLLFIIVAVDVVLVVAIVNDNVVSLTNI